MTLFKEHDKNKQAQSLADYMPNGRLWFSKNIPTTTFRKMLIGLGVELLKVERKMNEICTEHDIEQTERLITEWESALGIPDDCIKVADTLAERRDNVILKLASNGVSTEQDFIDLAATLGFTITILNGNEIVAWPWVWPHPWVGSAEEGRFTMVVTFVGVSAPSEWPWAWPHAWEIDPTSVLRCIFDSLKPANVKTIYQYQ